MSRTIAVGTLILIAVAGSQALGFGSYAAPNAMTRPDDFAAFWGNVSYQASLVALPADRNADGSIAFPVDGRGTCEQELARWVGSPMKMPVLHLTDWWADDILIDDLEGTATLHLRLLPGASREYGWDPSGLPDPYACCLRDAVLTARRGLRYLLSQPDVRAPKVGLVGEGFGGAVALALAALEPTHIAFVAIHQPMPAYHFRADGTPAASDYVLRPLERVNPDLLRDERQLQRSITYFDFFNFAPDVKAPAMVSYSVSDPVAGADQAMAVYSHLGGYKRLWAAQHNTHLAEADRVDFYAATYTWLQSVGLVKSRVTPSLGDPVFRPLAAGQSTVGIRGTQRSRIIALQR